MFTPRQYRARADEYSELIKGTDKPDEIREFQKPNTASRVVGNGDWMANNSKKTAHREDEPNTLKLTEDEGHILRCLGASGSYRWAMSSNMKLVSA